MNIAGNSSPFEEWAVGVFLVMTAAVYIGGWNFCPVTVILGILSWNQDPGAWTKQYNSWFMSYMIYIFQGWSLKLLSWARNLFCWHFFFSKHLRRRQIQVRQSRMVRLDTKLGVCMRPMHMLCSLIGWHGGEVSCKYPRYCRWFWLVRFSAKILCFFVSQFCWRDTKFPIIEYILIVSATCIYI